MPTTAEREHPAGAFATPKAVAAAKHASRMKGVLEGRELARMFAWMRSNDLVWGLALLPQPTLVMIGSDDPLVPEANGRILAHLIPDARLVVVDDGHLFLLTSAEESARRVSDFLGGSRDELADRSAYGKIEPSVAFSHLSERLKSAKGTEATPRVPQNKITSNTNPSLPGSH